jgi:hypothetical protein
MSVALSRTSLIEDVFKKSNISKLIASVFIEEELSEKRVQIVTELEKEFCKEVVEMLKKEKAFQKEHLQIECLFDEKSKDYLYQAQALDFDKIIITINVFKKSQHVFTIRDHENNGFKVNVYSNEFYVKDFPDLFRNIKKRDLL